MKSFLDKVKTPELNIPRQKEPVITIGLVLVGFALDKEHLMKELGDIAWYLAEAATALDLSLEDVLQANIYKLKKRYPNGFDSQKSQVRLQGDL